MGNGKDAYGLEKYLNDNGVSADKKDWDCLAEPIPSSASARRRLSRLAVHIGHYVVGLEEVS
jgi:hypothetical protein